MTGRRLARVSLRSRLLAISVTLLVVGLAVSNAIVLTALRGHLERRIDTQLLPLAALFARVPSDLIAKAPAGLNSVDVTKGLDLINDVYVAYLSPQGSATVAMRSPRHHGEPGPALPRLDTAGVMLRAGRVFEVPGQGDHGRWRVVVAPRLAAGGGLAAAQGASDASGSPGGGVVIAASLGEVNQTIASLRRVCLLTGGSLLGLLAVAGWFAVRAGLRPLRRIEQTAATIAGGDLTNRVPATAGLGTEIGRLSAALNGMLTQLEQAFSAREESEARMRRFVADMSHELRTPLFGIKGFAELYRMGGLPERDDVDRTMGRIESESGRLARMAEDLLLLARLDERAGSQAAPMDLRTLAADARYDLHGLDASREVLLTGPGGNGPPGSACVVADEARLRQVVSNLVGNATAHTPKGTAVRIGVGTTDGLAILELSDDGPGLSAEHAARVFERFYRVDGSRSRSDGGGVGLGLAIAQSLVEANGGRIELVTAPGRGATFRIVLPATE